MHNAGIFLVKNIDIQVDKFLQKNNLKVNFKIFIINNGNTEASFYMSCSTPLLGKFAVNSHLPSIYYCF